MCSRCGDVRPYGVMPMKLRHQEEAFRIGLTVLGTIAAAGIIASIAIAPGIALAFAPFARRPGWRQRGEVDRSLRRLVRRGFVASVRRGRVMHYRLTDRGRVYLMRCEHAHAAQERPKRWDGKWRILIFDIPEKQRHLRDMLRDRLVRLGFANIQKSVWLTPYPCDDVVRMLRVDLRYTGDIQAFTATSFLDRTAEHRWRHHFDV